MLQHPIGTRSSTQATRSTWIGATAANDPSHDHGARLDATVGALVAEDDPGMRRRIVTALQRDGFAVSEARDGSEALEIVRAALLEDGTPPALIIVDARMPGAAVIESLAELRPLLADTTVIVLADGDQDVAGHAARHVGTLGVMGAPLDLDDLRTIALDVGRRALHG